MKVRENNVRISPGMARRARIEAKRRSTSLSGLVERALRNLFSQSKEEEFIRQLRRGARKKGLTSQRKVAELVSNGRKKAGWRAARSR